ncbi:protein of unknown function [Nocardioides sp. YR527]|uniref:ImmA/IrrE family metallo-endopeptidase n=1 Tax=Nocardioides sp. YR527 TaxID=1881028 RepID=UPI00088E0604|nr:ImmA/IrrE family metallo-endopeptidase [Nocardioides sp. YR527]SDL17455.1 protein of unknown function [Nocardioides sp. YR527]
MRPLGNVAEIQGVAQSLLRLADVNERLPTPVPEIVAAAGLLEVDDYVLSESKISQAPRELRKLLRSAARKIRGALDRRERILHINPEIELPAQRKFVECHEIMHDALPWQRDLLVLGGTHKTLSPEIELRFEREANQGGAELLFQVDLMTRMARDYPVDVSTPVQLATMFGASLHSTFRRWIETHSGRLCGIVLDPTPVSIAPLTFQRFEVVSSLSWDAKFGGNRFPRRLAAPDHRFVAPPFPSNLSTEWRMTDLMGIPHDLRVQSFTNSYRTFVLLWRPGRERFIARHRARPRLSLG